MADEKIVRLPVSWVQRWRNKCGKRGVPCIVSGRWLEFGERGQGPYQEGEYIDMDVMTDSGEGKVRKICSLVVTREDLVRAISNVAPPSRPGGGPTPER
jgi:hypothetical protein